MLAAPISTNAIEAPNTPTSIPLPPPNETPYNAPSTPLPVPSHRALATPRGPLSLHKALLVHSARKVWEASKPAGVDGAIRSGDVETRRKSSSPKKSPENSVTPGKQCTPHAQEDEDMDELEADVSLDMVSWLEISRSANSLDAHRSGQHVPSSTSVWDIACRSGRCCGRRAGGSQHGRPRGTRRPRAGQGGELLGVSSLRPRIWLMNRPPTLRDSTRPKLSAL